MPKLSEIPIEVDEDEETIKIVQLVKSSDPTGQHKSSEPIVVSALTRRHMTKVHSCSWKLISCTARFEFKVFLFLIHFPHSTFPSFFFLKRTIEKFTVCIWFTEKITISI